ncbi:MAG: pyridoxal-phosphate dependent enzyme [Anaerolineae bacterium]|nr:pyridoxal-phosphate dependent enzyme [Anaerolineae bacterium]
MPTLFSAVRCSECGQLMDPDPYTVKCSRCGSLWLDAVYDSAALPGNWTALLRDRPYTLWRYEEFLPFPDDFQQVSMGEGWTPLTHADGLERETGHAGIWIKDERQSATGSFKDRQASVSVSALKAQGIKEIVLASTGNAAAAYAAYCARAGIKLWVFLSSSVPAEKMRELAIYGAEVIKLTGTYDQAKSVAADFATRRGIYLGRGAKSIPCKASMSTIAFEIAEQLHWNAPDWYVQSVSGGIGPIGVLKGFEDLKAAGIIDRVPKIAVVQTEGCSPMVRSWEKGLAKAEPVEHPDSLITILATGKPGMAYEILKQASDKYGGAMVSVSDGEAFRAMRHIARIEGFSMEPAASVAFAGLDKLLERGFVKDDETVVVNCSGHTFSAEKHALEDRYFLNLEFKESAGATVLAGDGLAEAFAQLDEQITTVVIIDDNPHDSRLIRRLLQKYKNYRVFEVNSGHEGVDLVRQRQPDLIVLDLTMPDMDGFSVLENLKSDERTAGIPVTIVSAKSLTPEDWKKLQISAESVWQKGNFSAQELVTHVVGILEEDLPLPEKTEFHIRRNNTPVQVFGQAQRQRILIIDQHITDARLMRRLFESRKRFEVHEVYSSSEALSIIEEYKFDMIILDPSLPDMNGESLIGILRIRDDTLKTPIIVVSAQAIDSETRARLAVHVDSVWSKATLDRSNFLAHVETTLPE